MNELIQTITIVVLLVYIAVSQYLTWKEREKLLKMIMAKDLREVTDNEVLEHMPKQEPVKPNEMMSMDDVIEDEAVFDKHIAAVKKQAEEDFDKSVDASN